MKIHREGRKKSRLIIELLGSTKMVFRVQRESPILVTPFMVLLLLAILHALTSDKVAALTLHSSYAIRTFRAIPVEASLAPILSISSHCQTLPFARETCLHFSKQLSEADQDRLLMGEVGLTAFIVAEMQHFVNETVTEFDQGLRFDSRWVMPPEEKLRLGLAIETLDVDNSGSDVILDEAYVAASSNMTASRAVETICNITEAAFIDGLGQPGLLSALGSAIMYFRDFYRTPLGIAACERIGLSDYTVAHHITDMYHHRTFRGAYTKTLPASGKGEIAAALAVGLPPPVVAMQHPQPGTSKGSYSPGNDNQNIQGDDDDDECLLWSPTTPGVCIHWKSEDAAWRKTRFERIQMEGTKDPRRGGSGTTR